MGFFVGLFAIDTGGGDTSLRSSYANFMSRTGRTSACASSCAHRYARGMCATGWSHDDLDLLIE